MSVIYLGSLSTHHVFGDNAFKPGSDGLESTARLDGGKRRGASLSHHESLCKRSFEPTSDELKRAR